MDSTTNLTSAQAPDLTSIEISVQTQDFTLQHEYDALVARSGGEGAGAVVTFVGRVRDTNRPHLATGDAQQKGEVSGLFLEHYPGMTEKALASLICEAKTRWPLLAVKIIHRVGQLNAGDQSYLWVWPVSTVSRHLKAVCT